MRILVISDVHANLTALEAVLRAAAPFDAVWCLGDLVGYGPDVNEVIDTVRQLPNLACVMGNHDSAVLGQIELSSFNREARSSILWTQDTITPDGRKFLQDLPEKHVIGNATIVHGSPRSPIWEYLLDSLNASENFDYFNTSFCFVGHTHIPIAYYWNGDGRPIDWQLLGHEDFPRLKGKMIVNPGSVGQPRDHDPRAAYAIFWPDLETWKTFRVEYDITGVQKRIQQANLPDRHAQRLMGGW
ncbi:MAG TPA: metallophosphoesterase family protein [Anaerolineaceae bacterium]|nr:metallophosphoesterase family protein [Anaerolineaceae bacterium]